MNGGLYQQVSGITIGDAVSLEVWHYWPDDPHDGSQAMELWLGIDPQGGTSATSGDIVWSDFVYATDTWQQLRAVTTAISTTVTVFLKAKSIHGFWPVFLSGSIFQRFC